MENRRNFQVEVADCSEKREVKQNKGFTRLLTTKSLTDNGSKRFITVFLMLLLTSCDPGVNYDCVIRNNSDYDVKIVAQIFAPWYLDGKDTLYNLPDTFVVHKKTSSKIATEMQLGSVYYFQNCNWRLYDSVSILVYLADTVKIIPNIHSIDYMNYWDFRITKEYRNGGGNCECRMILTNDMLLNNNEEWEK